MNKQILKIMTVIVSSVLLFGNLSFAQAGINQRPKNQQQRIRQGVRSGELTRREARRLEREQSRIQHDKRVAKSDGEMTTRERTRIQREQNRASRDIYRQKHDSQVRR